MRYFHRAQRQAAFRKPPLTQRAQFRHVDVGREFFDMHFGTVVPLPLVLIVDDEPLLRLVNADVLTDAGFEVLEAACADEALALLEKHSGVRVVFTDVEMPGGIDGFALADRIERRWPDIGVLVTSGRRFPVASFNAVAQRFVPKPYSIDHVVRLIGAFVDAQRQPGL